MFAAESEHLLGAMDAIEALRDLSGNQEQAVIGARSSERIELQTRVVIRPGNASQRDRDAISAMTADISNGGCMLLAPLPLMAGDIYWLEFPEKNVRVGALFGRCLRCRLVREGAFEVGMKFMTPIDLQTALNASQAFGDTGAK